MAAALLLVVTTAWSPIPLMVQLLNNTLFIPSSPWRRAIARYPSMRQFLKVSSPTIDLLPFTLYTCRPPNPLSVHSAIGNSFALSLMKSISVNESFAIFAPLSDCIAPLCTIIALPSRDKPVMKLTDFLNFSGVSLLVLYWYPP